MLELRVGQVFRLWCGVCRTPKWKYYTLALINPRPRYFLINSAPAAFQKSNTVLIAHLVSLPATDHPFLHHDSLLDCSTLMGGESASQLEDLYEQDQKVLMGEIAHAARGLALQVFTSSIVLTEREKHALLLAWT